MEGKTVLITGFSPFREEDTNPSWEIVKLLQDLQVKEYTIHTQEIPVSYRYVDENIKLLWDTFKPFFVIHVVVSPEVTEITVESKANNNGYTELDVDNFVHPSGQAREDGSSFIQTGFPTTKICEQFNLSESSNAGSFLAEYIYYRSLSINPNRCLLITVPSVDNPIGIEVINDGIKNIVLYIINWLEMIEKNGKIYNK